MTREIAAAERHRLVEALAQTLYEASDPSGVPWVKRSRIVRDAWLQRAEQQIPQTDAR